MTKKILVVVDYQKDFVDGSLGFDGAQQLDDLIVQRIEQPLLELSLIHICSTPLAKRTSPTAQKKPPPSC